MRRLHIIYLTPNRQVRKWGHLFPCWYYDHCADPGCRWGLIGLLWQGEGMTFLKSLNEFIRTTRVSVIGFIKWKLGKVDC
jgi:hypothetical protein